MVSDNLKVAFMSHLVIYALRGPPLLLFLPLHLTGLVSRKKLSLQTW